LDVIMDEKKQEGILNILFITLFQWFSYNTYHSGGIIADIWTHITITL
jgi:hypothetical protein